MVSSCVALSGGSAESESERKTRELIENSVIDDTPETISVEHTVYQAVNQPMLGGARMNLYLDSLKGKRVAIVGNQTSMIGSIHLVDTLLALGVKIQKVFSPEHGFRGDADAGEKVGSSIDKKTGIPLISLYGKNKKPHREQLMDVDVVIYDIQDVGVRFYTYISTLHYVMEACAENKKPIIVLDRPNPNGHYVDGPILESSQKSFVGMDPVPIVYGMTIGEYALMVNGEYWLSDSLQCSLWIVPCKYYLHKTKYVLPVAPSPNLRSEAAVTLYPSLCLFEATTVSVGRGTDRPFEMYGHPMFPNRGYCFTPVSCFGAKSPLCENQVCYGYDLQSNLKRRSYEINLNWILNAKVLLGDSVEFIDQPSFFNRLAGNAVLKQQIVSGLSAKAIRESWKPGLDNFKKIRQKYLLYD
jgi:uncharacterized protein YbbC (DUF1343 family)